MGGALLAETAAAAAANATLAMRQSRHLLSSNDCIAAFQQAGMTPTDAQRNA